MIHLFRALALAIVAVNPIAADEVVVLDAQAVVRHAYKHAPSLLAERERLGIALGELQQARLWPYQPELSVSGGPRVTDGNTTWDRSVVISQRFPLSGRQGAGVAVAEATVDETRASIAEHERMVVLQAVRQYLDAVLAHEQVTLARRAMELAQRVVAVTEQRRAASEANDLDVNVAAIALARALARLHEAEAEATASKADLTALLGMAPESSVTVVGTLDWAVPGPESLSGISQRPELARLQATRRAAEAAGNRAAKQGNIDPEFSLGYEHEEEAEIVLLGLRFALPVADRGQGDRAAAVAAARLAQQRLTAEHMRMNAEVTSAITRARVLKEVSDSFRTAVLPRLETNERLTEAAFRTGTLSFSEVLSQQREVLAAREEMLALSHRAAVAAAEAAAAAMSPPFTESSLHNHTPLPSGKDNP